MEAADLAMAEEPQMDSTEPEDPHLQGTLCNIYNSSKWAIDHPSRSPHMVTPLLDEVVSSLVVVVNLYLVSTLDIPTVLYVVPIS